MAHMQAECGSEVGGVLGSPLSSSSSSQKRRRAASLPSILPEPAKDSSGGTATDMEKEVTGL